MTSPNVKTTKIISVLKLVKITNDNKIINNIITSTTLLTGLHTEHF